MKNPYNLCSSGESLELASDQRELHDILSQYRLDKDMERLNQEILKSLLAEQEAEEMNQGFSFGWEFSNSAPLIRSHHSN